MSKLVGIQQIEVIAIESKNLDTVCYRGSAPLAYLAMISTPDIFDQVENPDGLQRDLSKPHASEAYEYANRAPIPDHPRAFPEVVLNVRDRKVVDVQPIEGTGEHGERLVRLTFSVEKMPSGKVSVSRVDGNHRLYYADGDDRREPLLSSSPFQIHVGLSREQERSLFVDINSNQKGLNTSHLAVMQGKLTPEEREIRDNPDRWIANRLAMDPESAWHGLIHMGGSKVGSRAQGLTRPVNFASLQAGVNRILAKSQYIHDLSSPQARYVLIRNYWEAVRRVFAPEWASPKQYLLLKNVGVLSLSILGGTIIDRCMPRGRIAVDDMAFYLQQCRDRFDWNKDTIDDRGIAGMSGNRAALLIAGAMAEELSDVAGTNAIKELQEQLLAGQPA